MTVISDDEMRSQLQRSRGYTLVLLTAGPAYGTRAAEPIVWEHGRRNFALRADGLLSIVCPVLDDSPLCGVAIFDLDPEATRAVMDQDPGVAAGVFGYEVHPVRSFPGDALPG